MNYSDYDRFELVGARITKVKVDEARFLAIPDSTDILTSIARRAPVLSMHQYEDRPVIEIAVSVGVSMRDEDDSLMSIECVAGFVGRKKEQDGDLSAFTTMSDHYARGVYWMIRMRMEGLFSATIFRSSSLPWDLENFDEGVLMNETVPTKERPKKKAKPRKDG